MSQDTPLLSYSIWIYVSHIMTWLSLLAVGLAFKRYLEQAVDLIRAESAPSVVHRTTDRLTASALGLSSFSFLIFIDLPIVAALLCGVLVFLITPKILRRRRLVKYEKDFDASLVESLTTIGSSLKAGLTLKDALVVAVQNCPPVFGNEMARVLKDYHFGMSIDKALDGVRRRVRTKNANTAMGALIIGTQLGGRLPETLARIVSTIREVDRVEGRLKALTSQGRAQGVLLCSMPIVIFLAMYFFDRPKIDIMQSSTTGQFLLGLVVFLEVLGIIITARVMRLDV